MLGFLQSLKCWGKKSLLKPNPSEQAVALMKEMGLDYVGINIRSLPWDWSVVISRYDTLGCNCSDGELQNKPIPTEFVSRIRELFPDRKVIVKETMTTSSDLAAERQYFRTLQGEG